VRGGCDEYSHDRSSKYMRFHRTSLKSVPGIPVAFIRVGEGRAEKL
jgi:hypothetical protein